LGEFCDRRRREIVRRKILCLFLFLILVFLESCGGKKPSPPSEPEALADTLFIDKVIFGRGYSTGVVIDTTHIFSPGDKRVYYKIVLRDTGLCLIKGWMEWRKDAVFLLKTVFLPYKDLFSTPVCSIAGEIRKMPLQDLDTGKYSFTLSFLTDLGETVEAVPDSGVLTEFRVVSQKVARSINTRR